MRCEEALETARRRLRRAPFAPPPREATLLLGRVLGIGEAQVLARLDDELPAAAERSFFDLLERRLTGEPVAYLYGRREFYGREFLVDPRVLIPRPETEHLVEAALGLDLPPGPRILDVGSGSGCVAITLALELNASRVVASDISLGALALTAANAERHGVTGTVSTLCADLTRGVGLDDFDLVISNPPYIGESERGDLSCEIVDFEPAAALFGGGAAGLDLIRRLVDELSSAPPGLAVMLEVGAGQAAQLIAELDGAALAPVECVDDYAGVTRVVVLKRS